MPSSELSYFFSSVLQTRFAQDIREALRASRIDAPAADWLRRLVDSSLAHLPAPRVDKVLAGETPFHDAELAAAWMLSDPAAPQAPVYLSTLAVGLERFASRAALLISLKSRFRELRAPGLEVDVELIEGSVFEQRMVAMLTQQAWHLQTCFDQLHLLPTLQAAAANALQTQLDVALPGTIVDVSRQLVQILATQSAAGELPHTAVVGTQTLADAAFQRCSGDGLAQGLERRFFSGSGASLEGTAAAPYVQALDTTATALPGSFERLLDQYWSATLANGSTRRENVGQVLMQAFRHVLLKSRIDGSLTEHEYRSLRLVLPAAGAQEDRELVLIHRLAVDVSATARVVIAGVLLIEFLAGQLPGMYLFSASAGLTRIANRQQLNAHFADPDNRQMLLRHIALPDHVQVQALKTSLRIHTRAITGDPFAEHAALIVELQRRNLMYALNLPAAGYDMTAVRVDDALDIRALMDRRLCDLQGSWRWQTQPDDFHSSWLEPDGAPTQPHREFPVARLTWAVQMQKLDGLTGLLARLHPGAKLCMLRELDRYLSLLELPQVEARFLRLAPSASELRARELWSVALGRLSGAPQGALPSNAVLQQLSPAGVASPFTRLPIRVLDAVIACAVANFAARYEQQLTRFHTTPIRSDNAQIFPARVSRWILEQALRLRLAVAKGIGQLDDPARHMLRQVLDRPEPMLRQALGDDRVDAFRLRLADRSGLPPMSIPGAFVLTSPKTPDRHLLCVPGMKMQVLASLQALSDELNGLLARAGKAVPVFSLFCVPDQQRLLKHLAASEVRPLTLTLEKIDGHFIHALQADGDQRRLRNAQSGYQTLTALKLLPEVFCNALTAIERDDGLRPILDLLALMIEAVIDNSIIPQWLRVASIADQDRMLQALQRFIVCTGQRDFLFDIPEIYTFSRGELTRRLATDFPDKQLDPDAIDVTLTHYVPAPVPVGQVPSWIPAATGVVRERLTDFAVNRFFSLRDGIITVSMADGTENAALTPLYIQELVRSLDVSSAYRLLLDTLLSKDDVDYGLRRRLFAEQLPALDGLRAIEYELRKLLSPKAQTLVQAVLNMPDGVARLPVDGCKVVFSLLRLNPGAGWQPTTVHGIYLIYPQPPEPGTWVLYTPFGGDATFKEFPDQGALLADIHTSAGLQASILERMDPDQRPLYEHGGFIEPHLPFSTESSFDVPLRTPAPVTLNVEPVLGNALEVLFSGAVQILKMQTRLLTVTNAEHSRDSSNYLLGLVAEQLLAFAPGRLGALVGVWQSRELLQSSMTALGNQRWGKALSEFMAAISVLVSSRQMLDGEPGASESGADELVAGEPDAGETAELTPRPEFSWSNQTLTPQLQVRLRSLEARDVALSNLRHEEAFNTYFDDDTGQRYVALGGVVYPVRQSPDGWFIGSEDTRGPAIGLDSNQQWELDLQGGLRGGGSLPTRIKSTLVDADVDRLLVLRATGMEEIRQLRRDQAECIEQAHARARFYLENCLANLNLRDAQGVVDPRTFRIIADFFNQPNPDPRLHEAVRQVAVRLYDALIDPSLSPQDSTRIVVGLSRLAQGSDTTAFTFVRDPFKRVFLTEHFFRLPTYRFKAGVFRSGGFDYGSHYRAAILLHELSHLALGTEDIAYVDAFAPYLDLLEDGTGYRLRVKNEQIAQQQQALSSRTERAQLFKQLDRGEWRDLRRRDSDAKDLILRLTGKRTLSEARDVFFADVEKRSQVMLGNADSVALLMTLLGRERFTPLQVPELPA